MSANDDDDRLGTEAMDLANELQLVFSGHNTAAVYLAISMVLGYMQSLAQRPDIDGMLAVLKKGIVEERDRQLARRAAN